MNRGHAPGLARGIPASRQTHRRLPEIRRVRCANRPARMVKWDPFRELEKIQARLNRMFGERSFRGIDADDLSLADGAPAVDIQETDTSRKMT